MATVRTIVTEALRENNIVAYNETPSSSDIMLGLRRFNLFVDLLKADKLTIQEVKRSTFSLVASQTSYTIGPAGNWVVERPMFIARAGFVDTIINATNPPETKIDVLTDEEWADITVKSTTAPSVQALWYYRNFSSAEAGTIFVWPVCTVAAQVALYLPNPLDEVAETSAGLDTAIYTPPGYRLMLIMNLALNLAGPFEKEASASTIAQASSSMDIVKRSNIRPMVAKMPERLMHLNRNRAGGQFNVRTGE